MSGAIDETIKLNEALNRACMASDSAAGVRALLMSVSSANDAAPINSTRSRIGMLLDEINTRFTNLPPDLWEKVKNPVGVLSAATSGAKGLPAIR